LNITFGKLQLYYLLLLNELKALKTQLNEIPIINQSSLKLELKVKETTTN